MVVSGWGWRAEMTDILVLGERGQVARALRRVLPDDGSAIFAGREVADLSRPGTVQGLIQRTRPKVVINAAAYTAVDKAESEPELAMAVNATGPGAAARAAAEVGAAFVHYSTDYVFDGEAARPYVETDPTAPLGVYGRTKLQGEVAVVQANPRHVILRTAWIYGADGGNFVRTMLRLAAEREEIGVVDDQRGQPTFADDLAAVGAHVAESLSSDDRPELYGIFHAAGSEDLTWCGFARAIMAASAARGGPSCRVKAITSADYPTPVRRPADSRLSSDRLRTVHGIAPGSWRYGLDTTLDRLLVEPRNDGATR